MTGQLFTPQPYPIRIHLTRRGKTTTGLVIGWMGTGPLLGPVVIMDGEYVANTPAFQPSDVVTYSVSVSEGASVVVQPAATPTEAPPRHDLDLTIARTTDVQQ